MNNDNMDKLNTSMESQMNMDTIRINIKYIMLGMICGHSGHPQRHSGHDHSGHSGHNQAGMEGMPTIITEALRNFS